jgi:hypothetical protein
MTMNVAKGERDAAIKTFHSILVVILLATFLSGLIVAIAIELQMTYSLLPIKNVSDNVVAVVMFVQWLQVIVGQIGGQIYAGYRCDGNFAIGTAYLTFLRLGEFLISIAALSAGGDFFEIALYTLLVRILGMLAIGIGMKRRSPWLTMGLSQSSCHGQKYADCYALHFLLWGFH